MKKSFETFLSFITWTEKKNFEKNSKNKQVMAFCGSIHYTEGGGHKPPPCGLGLIEKGTFNRKGYIYLWGTFLRLQGTFNRDFSIFWKRVRLIERVLIIENREYFPSIFSKYFHQAFQFILICKKIWKISILSKYFVQVFLSST